MLKHSLFKHIKYIKMKRNLIASLLSLIFMCGYSCPIKADERKSEKTNITVKVDFATTLQEWDGCGVNYVQMAQSIDPINDPQDYGGFSRLSEPKRQEIIDLIFGKNGLQPNIIKMFLDPFHQKGPQDEFDHNTTTTWMRYFAKEGVRKTKEAGNQNIEIITTLYGPPAWATKQKILRGRDLDASQYKNLAIYMIDWVKFLIEKEDLPVKYLSVHNEGDSPNRWPLDGSQGNIGTGQDYNVFWRPWEVAHFLEFMYPMMEAVHLDVGLTPGECTTWRHFSTHWYHWAIHDNEKALNNMALITSHGFGDGDAINSQANDLLRHKRPELHAWTTSMTWGGQKGIPNYMFMDYIRRNIYNAKVNAVIPWATIQTSTWVGGDPNPGTAFFISESGNYEVRPQYYYFKQLCRVGQRGMKVAYVETEKKSGIELIAFCSNGTNHPNAFLIMNLTDSDKEVTVEIYGTSQSDFAVTRSSQSEKCKDIGIFSVTDRKIIYHAPGGSISTFVQNHQFSTGNEEI